MNIVISWQDSANPLFQVRNETRRNFLQRVANQSFVSKELILFFFHLIALIAAFAVVSTIVEELRV